MTSVSEVAASAEHQVFRIDGSGPATYLKLAEPADLVRELAVLQLLRGCGIPVAEVEAADPDGAGTEVPCLLLRGVAGTPTTAESAQFRAAAPVLRQVHQIGLGGSGYLTASGGTLHGQSATWVEAMTRQIGDPDAIAGSGLTDASLLERASALVWERLHVFESPHNGHLVHGDFHPRHVYVSGGRVTGVIDWGDASAGDPRYDLGRVLHAVVVQRGVAKGRTVLRQFLGGYGDAPWLSDKAGLAEAVLVYAIVFTLAAMHSELAGGSPWPPWWPTQTAALAAITGELHEHT